MYVYDCEIIITYLYYILTLLHDVPMSQGQELCAAYYTLKALPLTLDFVGIVFIVALKVL